MKMTHPLKVLKYTSTKCEANLKFLIAIKLALSDGGNYYQKVIFRLAYLRNLFFLQIFVEIETFFHSAIVCVYNYARL